MWNYLGNLLFWCMFIFIIYAFGNSLRPQKEGQAVKFVAGYLGYSFLVAIGGITIQLLNIKWTFFAGYMCVVIAGIIIWSIWKKRKRTSLFSCSVKEYISDNWFVFLVCMILCMMLLFYYRSFWYGNHLDDGYYITKIATVAHDSTNYKSNFSVGIGEWAQTTYLINTWELEASFFVTVLRLSPTLFLRFFQSGFHYFVFLNCALAFGEKIVSGIEKKTCDQRKNRKSLQYVLGVFLIFFVYYIYMQDAHFFFLRDSFQLNTAMFYGSAIAKLIVIMCLLIFCLQEDKINLKMIIRVGMICVVMISKTTVVLPILFVTIASSCIVWFLQSEDKRIKAAGIILMVLYVIAGVIVPANWGIQNEVYTYVRLMVKSPVMWICAVAFLMSFTLKSKMVYRVNGIMIISGAMIVVPQVNDLFELCSVYAFVGGRAWSMWVYTFVVLSSFYWYVILTCKCEEAVVRSAYIIITAGMVVLLLYGVKKDGAELFLTDDMPDKTLLIQDMKVMLKSRKFMPNATLELGQELEKIAEITEEQLYVVSPQMVVVNGAVHTLSTQLRIVAPDVISVSASNRYEVDEDCELYGYNQEKFESFAGNPNEKSFRSFEKEIEKYHINCIVTQNESCGEYLKTIGFQKQELVGDGAYFVWYRP